MLLFTRNVRDGYALTIMNEARGLSINPGAVLVEKGEWNVGGMTLFDGEAAEIMHPTMLSGDGLIAVAEEPLNPSLPYALTGPLSRVIPRTLTRHDKPWGFELEVPTSAKKLQLKLLQVDTVQRTSLQTHAEKDEVMFFIEGGGPVELDVDLLVPGVMTSITVPPGLLHRVTGHRRYFEASTYHPDDVRRHEDDYGRPCEPV